jgi:hypothetical protein
MEQLHDIEGPGPISFWPLAIGWWILIGCGALLLWLLLRRLIYLKSWQRAIFKQLDRLEKNLSPYTSGETVSFLSEFLRRIAMRRFPRKECAGLVGDSWLQWLTAHDPKQFDWISKGKLLIEVPYAPLHQDLPLEQIQELIQAVRNWVH